MNYMHTSNPPDVGPSAVTVPVPPAPPTRWASWLTAYEVRKAQELFWVVVTSMLGVLTAAVIGTNWDLVTDWRTYVVGLAVAAGRVGLVAAAKFVQGLIGQGATQP